MITSLSLINFRRHRELSVEFQPGLNLICGPNWAGKTTVLSALSYGLFGTKATPGTADQLVTQGEKAMSVTVGFSAGDEAYRVVRTPKTASLYLEGREQPLATGHSPVTMEVEDRLGILSKDFLAFHVTRQSEAAALLTLGSAKLNEYVAKVTGVDIVDRVLDRTKDELTKASAAAHWAIGSSLSQEQVEELRARVEQLVGSQTRLKAELGLNQQECDYLLPELQEARQALLDLEQSYVQAEAGRRAAAVAEGVLKAAQVQLAELRSDPLHPVSSAEQLAALRNELATAHSQYQNRVAAEQAVLSLTARKAAAEEGLAAWQAELARLPPDVSAQTFQNLLDAERLMTAAADQLHLAERALLNSECPTCGRAFEDADQKKLTEDIEVLKEPLLWATDRYHKATEEHKVATKEREQYSAAEAACRSWEQELEQVEKSLSEQAGWLECPYSGEAIHDLNHQLEMAAEANRAAFEWQSKLTRWEQEEVSAREKHTQALEAANKGASHSALAKARALEATLNEQVTAAGMRRARLTGDLNGVVSLLKSGQAELEKAAEALASTKLIVERRDTLAELSKFLRQNRDRFTVSVWDQLLSHASQFVAEATSGAVTALARGADGEFSYEEGGLLRGVDGNASGMQETIFSTAVKLSLAAALGSRFGTFLFDEVTAAASDETSLTFLGRLASAGSQVILVTHRSGDAAMADHLVQL